MCSFLQGTLQDGKHNDHFEIDGIMLYKGKKSKNIYTVDGDILSGFLHKLFMNFLAEKGISNEFVDKLSQFSTSYEDRTCIETLGQFSNFVKLYIYIFHIILHCRNQKIYEKIKIFKKNSKNYRSLKSADNVRQQLARITLAATIF
jgi:hypothetical protein